MEPITAIISGFLVLLFVIWMFYPGKGIIALLQKGKKSTEKILIEDTLKYVYDCYYKSLPCSIDLLADHLQISKDDVEDTLEKLDHLSLITKTNDHISLTDGGKSYALKIIRVHRIWERYLADETGVAEMEWHPRADDKEHRISYAEANQLAAKIGNPVFDPHGDPIPSQKGNIPSHKGEPLHAFNPGDIVNVLHIEDEPDVIYKQLVAIGLHAHMKLKIVEKDADKIKFLTQTDELVLALSFAENITVIPIMEELQFDESSQKLTSLKLGESAKIIGLSPACRGQQRRRLMDLGIIPGSKIKVLMYSPTGEPVGYEVMGATIAFRKEQAEQIHVAKI